MSKADTGRTADPAGSVLNGKGIFRFVIFSLIGIFLFFTPAFSGQVTLVFLVNTVKALLGPLVPYASLMICGALLVLMVLDCCFHVPLAVKFYETVHPFRKFIFILAFILVAMVLTGTAPWFVMDERIGPNAVSLAASIFLTVMFAGWAVVFILNSGMVEFVAVLIEPVMRPVFRLPGITAVNALSAFVSSSSIGIYITDQNYLNRRYTRREAFAVASSFSVMSIGYMGVLCNITGIEEHYIKVVCSSFILVWIIAAIVIRIPPLTLEPDTYIDGAKLTEEDKKIKKMDHRFRAAVEAAVKQSETLTKEVFWNGLFDAVQFGIKVAAFIIPVVITVLSIVYYTPLFSWISRPIVPFLELLRLPNAAQIAPSTIIGLIEVTLPSISIAGLGVAEQSCFFVVVLSAVQIIFFTECANAMFEAHFGATAPKLVAVFFVRTIIAIPLVALMSHLLF